MFIGLLCVFFVGMQPIVANARPTEIDAYIFAAMTVFIEAVIFLPVMLVERKKLKANFEAEIISSEDFESLMFGYKNNKLLFLYVGLTFAICQILFFVGYRIAGAINGSLAQKTTVLFSLTFAYFINKEKITKSQVFFSCLLFFGLTLAITQGNFNLLQFNIGVLMIVMVALFWMLAHSLTRPVFDRKESTPSQMTFTRNAIKSIYRYKK